MASLRDASADKVETDGAGVEEMPSPLVPRSRRPLSTSPIPQVDGNHVDSESEEEDDASTPPCCLRRRRPDPNEEEDSSGADSDALPWKVYRIHQRMSEEDNRSTTPHFNSAGWRRPTRQRP